MAEGYRDRHLAEFLEAVAARTPAPGGGAGAATTVALAASLVAMAASYTGDSADLPNGLADGARRRQARALDLADEDAAAYTAVLEARRSGDAEERRVAWQRAIAVPLEIAECGARTAQDAVWLVEHGRAALRGDAFTGAVLAEAAVRAAVRLVEIDAAAAGGADEEVARAWALADDAGNCVRRLSTPPTARN